MILSQLSICLERNQPYRCLSHKLLTEIVSCGNFLSPVVTTKIAYNRNDSAQSFMVSPYTADHIKYFLRIAVKITKFFRKGIGNTYKDPSLIHSWQVTSLCTLFLSKLYSFLYKKPSMDSTDHPNVTFNEKIQEQSKTFSSHEILTLIA